MVLKFFLTCENLRTQYQIKDTSFGNIMSFDTSGFNFVTSDFM